ncbi:MAG TPA: hypothetical protein VGN69_10560 [Solirubrobacteraceae bacterium]|jgi:hypothetical protein|nr:hypothetical protein [Solirubrobacteraceae bacterium]
MLAIGVSGCGQGKHSAAGPAPADRPVPGEIGQNVARITGSSPGDAESAAILAAYPPSGDRRPNGWIIVRRSSWHDAVVAAQFAAGPINAAILPVSPDFTPTPAKDLMVRVKPDGFPLSHGIKAIILGKVGPDVLGDLSFLKLNPAQLQAKTPAELSAKLVPYRGGFAHAFSGQVLVVSEQDRDYALPAGAWSAYSGDTVAFVKRNSVPRQTAGLLSQRAKLKAEKPTIYLLGPPSVISASVAAQLRAYGPVKRIAGRDAVSTAVAFARYRDPTTGFGWGLRRGPANISLINMHNWGYALGAFQFSATGPQGPLLLTSRPEGLPAPVLQYLNELANPLGNQGYVFGTRSSLSPGTLQQLDGVLAPRK